MNYKVAINFAACNAPIVVVAMTKEEALARANNVAVEMLRCVGGAPVSFIMGVSMGPTIDEVNDVGVSP